MKIKIKIKMKTTMKLETKMMTTSSTFMVSTYRDNQPAFESALAEPRVGHCRGAIKIEIARVKENPGFVWRN